MKCNNYDCSCHPNLLLCNIIKKDNPNPSTEDCDDTGKVGASAAGGFVGGVLITAVLGIGIHFLLVRRMTSAHKRNFSKQPTFILFLLLMQN